MAERASWPIFSRNRREVDKKLRKLLSYNEIVKNLVRMEGRAIAGIPFILRFLMGF